ncbi:hypothetical protein RJ639_022988 [Escallonia herrerae]|uniref:Uncharacterized protein n=1 Tax=Escallonia herrerae TaxID=1293975 RepID=A0AA88V0S8_9ASTE|nr:hypothetical protein RJ639_022988 [Escallonia herrerae]
MIGKTSIPSIEDLVKLQAVVRGCSSLFAPGSSSAGVVKIDIDVESDFFISLERKNFFIMALISCNSPWSSIWFRHQEGLWAILFT